MRLSEFATAIRHVADAPTHANKIDALVELLQSVDVGLRIDAAELVSRALPVAGSDDEHSHQWPSEQVAAVPTAFLQVADVVRTLRRADERTLSGHDDECELLDLLGAATTDEQEFLRSLRLGSAATFEHPATLVSAIAQVARVRVREIRRTASIVGSLAEVAGLVLADGADALQAIDVVPGRPVMPMLPSPADDAVHDLVTSERFVVEARPRGTRIQAHRHGDVVDLFDRSFAGVNDRFPHVVSLVSGLARGDLVLDGIVLDEPTQPGAPPDVLFFDMLYDGESLLDAPLATRREHLSSLVRTSHRVASAASSAEVLDQMLRQSARDGHDGVMVKDLTAAYECGHASSSWCLVRPSFSLYLLVVAAEWGTGSRSDRLSIIQVAATGDDGRPVVIARVSRGMSTETRDWQTARFGELEVGSEQARDHGVVRLRPEIVAQVSCSGFEPSNRFPSGLALRSPRLVRYRDRESTTKIATVEDVRRLHDESSEAASTAPRPTLPPARVMRPDVDSSASNELHSEYPPVSPAPHPAAADLRPTDLVDQLDYEPYEAPTLIDTTVAARAVLGARGLALLWSLALAIAAVATPRTDLLADGGAVSVIAPFGFAVVALLAVTGWWWSDRTTRVLRQLDGRRPTRVRCATAWLVPLVVALLLQVTVVQAEPSETFDVRPLVIGVAFAAVVWRPYALIRRILATLIRVRSDALVAGGYLIDTAALGVSWWRLAAIDGSATSVEADSLVGTLLAVAFVQVAGLVVWYLLVRNVRRAVQHRASSQQTRYEHRMLRLRGVDPTDPEVWWGLVRRRATEAQAEERATGTLALEGLDSQSVDEMVEEVRAANVRTLRRLGSNRSRELLDHLRERFSTALTEINEQESTATGGIERETLETVELGDVADDAEVATMRATQVEEMPTEDAFEPGLGRDADRRVTDEPDQDDLASTSSDDEIEAEDVIVEPATESTEEDTSVSEVPEVPEVPEIAVDPEVSEISEVLEVVEDPVVEDPVVAEVSEASRDDEAEQPTDDAKQPTVEVATDSPLAQLMREARSVQFESALAEHRQRDVEEHTHSERMVTPRLVSLEAARYAMILGFGGLTVAAGWMANVALGSETFLSRLTPEAVVDFERSRRTLVAVYFAALVLVPLWSWVASIQADRAGAPGTRRRLHLVLFVAVAVAAVSASFVQTDDRAGMTILFGFAAAVLAGVSVALLEPTRHWFDLRSTTLVAWAVSMPALLALAALSGLMAPADTSSSLQVLGFSTVILTLGAALTAVLIALSSVDLEDEIKLSPSMAVPARRSRRDGS